MLIKCSFVKRVLFFLSFLRWTISVWMIRLRMWWTTTTEVLITMAIQMITTTTTLRWKCLLIITRTRTRWTMWSWPAKPEWPAVAAPLRKYHRGECDSQSQRRRIIITTAAAGPRLRAMSLMRLRQPAGGIRGPITLTTTRKYKGISLVLLVWLRSFICGLFTYYWRKKDIVDWELRNVKYWNFNHNSRWISCQFGIFFSQSFFLNNLCIY